MPRRLPKILDVDLHLPRPPFWLVAALMIAVVLSWVPLAVIVWARMTPSTEPRYYPIQDMVNQPGYRAQQENPLFRDGRAMREPAPGTVAWGPSTAEPDADALRLDDHYYRGYRLEPNGTDEDDWQVAWYESIPPQLEVDVRFLERGQEQFNIYCYTCHGKAGDGRGPINERALELAARPHTSWTPATNLHDDRLQPEQYPDGQMFDIISNGIRDMPAYDHSIKVEDRWAIVAYVRALQQTQRDEDE